MEEGREREKGDGGGERKGERKYNQLEVQYKCTELTALEITYQLSKISIKAINQS